LVVQPAEAFPDEVTPPERTQAWHYFPGTAVYRYGPDGLVVALGVALICLMVIGGVMVFGPRQPRPALVPGWR
jgi:hypothetical protein